MNVELCKDKPFDLSHEKPFNIIIWKTVQHNNFPYKSLFFCPGCLLIYFSTYNYTVNCEFFNILEFNDISTMNRITIILLKLFILYLLDYLTGIIYKWTIDVLLMPKWICA